MSSQSNTTELSVDLLTEQVFNSHLFKKMKHHSTSIPPLFPPTHTSQHHQANSTQVPSISTPGPGGQGVNSSPQSRSPSLSFAGSESDSASGINRPPEERVEGISSSSPATPTCMAPGKNQSPSQGLTWSLVVACSGCLSPRTRMNRGKRREIPFSLSTCGREQSWGWGMAGSAGLQFQ